MQIFIQIIIEKIDAVSYNTIPGESVTHIATLLDIIRFKLPA